MSSPSGSPSAFSLVALRHRASGRYVPYATLRAVAHAFGAPLVPCLATWSPSAALCELARFEPRRALDEAIAELRHLLKHTAPARGGAVQGGMLFLPSGLTLKLSATPPSKLSSAVAGWAGADNAEMVEAAQPSRSAVQLVAAAGGQQRGYRRHGRRLAELRSGGNRRGSDWLRDRWLHERW